MTEVNSRALLDAEPKRLGPPLKLPSVQDPISFTGKLRCVEQNTPFDPKKTKQNTPSTKAGWKFRAALTLDVITHLSRHDHNASSKPRSAVPTPADAAADTIALKVTRA